MCVEFDAAGGGSNMDPVILHHGISESVAIGLVASTAIVAFTAGAGFARLYRQRSQRRIESAVETAE